MAFKLREYQVNAISAIRDELGKGYRGILLSAPCGSGKGSIIAYIMGQAVQRGNRCEMLAHRSDLVIGPNAIGDRLRNQIGIPSAKIGYLIPKAKLRKYGIDPKRGTGRDIVLGTVQTASRRKPVTGIDILIVDEAHRIRTGMYERTLVDMVAANPNIVVIGFTATPERYDGKPLGAIFQVLVQVSTHGEMVQQRYLVPSSYKYPLNVDLTGVKIRAGDYIDSELENIYTDEVLNAIVDQWEKLGGREKKTIFFTINRKTQAHFLAEILRGRGFMAESIVSDTDDRVELLEDFKNNHYQVLVNVNLFTEGVSIDDVECIVLAFATQSATKYVQAASRGARPIWGKNGEWKKGPDGEYVKDHCLILDFGGNVQRHGKLEHYGMEGFDIHRKKKKRKGEAPVKVCEECRSYEAASARVCSQCGTPFPESDVEASKALANQVEWGVDDPHRAFFLKFRKLSQRQIYNGLKSQPKEKPELLLPIQAAKGYRDGWAVNMLFDLNYRWAKNKNKKSKTDWDNAHRYLSKKTKDAGYWVTYNNFLQERIKEETNATVTKV